jgi:hypothetical protein
LNEVTWEKDGEEFALAHLKVLNLGVTSVDYGKWRQKKICSLLKEESAHYNVQLLRHSASFHQL